MFVFMFMFKPYAGARKTGGQIPRMWNTVLTNLANKADYYSKGCFAFEVGYCSPYGSKTFFPWPSLQLIV